MTTPKPVPTREELDKLISAHATHYFNKPGGPKEQLAFNSLNSGIDSLFSALESARAERDLYKGAIDNSYVTNCYITPRLGDDALFQQIISPGGYVVRLDGYEIRPIELQADLSALQAKYETARQAIDWVLDDAKYKAPEQWNELSRRWYGKLSAALPPSADERQA